MTTPEPRAVHPPDKMASVRIIKEFNYLGSVREFSNRYHIGTNMPQTGPQWDNLLTAIMSAEALMFTSFANNGARVVKGVGIGPNSNLPVHELAFEHDGSLPATGLEAVPGDCAALLRCTTPDRSVRNHPIYLFSYWHSVHRDAGAGADRIATSQLAALQAYSDKWLAGFSDGTTTYHRSRPNNGTLITGGVVETFFTHRDLPRS
jgi:hypothetical protein